jgi:Phage integrase family
MSPELTWALRERRGNPSDLVFTAERGARLDQSNVAGRVLKPAAVKAGVGVWVETPKGQRAESWVGFHTFRRPCGTLKITEEGWTLEQVQMFLGHRDFMTTRRYYAHLVSTAAPEQGRSRGVGTRWAQQPPIPTETPRALKPKIAASPVGADTRRYASGSSLVRGSNPTAHRRKPAHRLFQFSGSEPTRRESVLKWGT